MVPAGTRAIELEMAQPIRGFDERRSAAGRCVCDPRAVMAGAKADLLRQCRHKFVAKEGARYARSNFAAAAQQFPMVAQQDLRFRTGIITFPSLYIRFHIAPMHVLFEDDGQLKAGTVLADHDQSLQVEAVSGKRLKIKAASVLLRFASPGPAEALGDAQRLTAELD